MKSAAFPGIAAMFTPPSPSRKHFPGRKMRTPCQLPLIMVLIAFDVITSIKDESEGAEKKRNINVLFYNQYINGH